MVTQEAGRTARRLVSLLKGYPQDRIQHNATFKSSQIIRFCNIGNIPIPNELIEESKKQRSGKGKMIELNAERLRKSIEEAKSPEQTAYQKDIFTENILEQQYKSLKSIVDSKWGNYYKLGDKLLKPKGNPNYYTRLLNDLNKGGQQKEALFTAWKTILTGKY